MLFFLFSFECKSSFFLFFNDTATTEIYTYGHTLSLHDALPISARRGREGKLCLLRHRAVGDARDAGALEARGRFHDRQSRRGGRPGLCRQIFPARNQGGDGQIGQKCHRRSRRAERETERDEARKQGEGGSENRKLNPQTNEKEK